MLAVLAAVVIKTIAAELPLIALRGPSRPARDPPRVLAWAEAAILIVYGPIQTAAGLLDQTDLITVGHRRSSGAPPRRRSHLAGPVLASPDFWFGSLAGQSGSPWLGSRLATAVSPTTRRRLVAFRSGLLAGGWRPLVTSGTSRSESSRSAAGMRREEPRCRLEGRTR